MKTLWLLAFFVVAASVHDTEASFPPDKDSHPDGYWFGTQNLNCMMNTENSMRGAPWRFIYSWSHRVIYYRNAVYERKVEEDKIRSQPDWDEAQKCPITWESSPAGYSQCSVDEVQKFVSGYRDHYGGYSVLLNNCHIFANRVSKFLYDSNCGRNGWPS